MKIVITDDAQMKKRTLTKNLAKRMAQKNKTAQKRYLGALVRTLDAHKIAQVRNRLDGVSNWEDDRAVAVLETAIAEITRRIHAKTT